jgi:hypothetical protein
LTGREEENSAGAVVWYLARAVLDMGRMPPRRCYAKEYRIKGKKGGFRHNTNAEKEDFG